MIILYIISNNITLLYGLVSIVLIVSAGCCYTNCPKRQRGIIKFWLSLLLLQIILFFEYIWTVGLDKAGVVEDYSVEDLIFVETLVGSIIIIGLTITYRNFVYKNISAKNFIFFLIFLVLAFYYINFVLDLMSFNLFYENLGDLDILSKLPVDIQVYKPLFLAKTILYGWLILFFVNCVILFLLCCVVSYHLILCCWHRSVPKK